MTITIKPGDTYYAKLPDGRYEKCVLQPTTDGTPNRHEAARGGTGAFYRVLHPKDLRGEQLTAAIENDANILIWDLDENGYVYLTPDEPLG